MPDGSDEDIKYATWFSSLDGFSLPPVTSEIIASLKKDGYYSPQTI